MRNEIRTSRNRVQSVDRALSILQAFTEQDTSLGISELSRRTGLSKPVVFRITQTMSDRGFIEQDPETAEYRIGLRAFEVGALYYSHMTLERRAIGPMREMEAKQGYNVYLAVLDGRHVVYLAAVDSRGPIQVRVAVGSRAYAHTTAVGKVLLAYLPADQLHELLTSAPLEALTPKTITSVPRLERQLAEIRQRGVAINAGETFLDTGALAAPIRDRSGKVLAAVSNGYPLYSVSEADLPRLMSEVVECADAISRLLGAKVPEREVEFGRQP
jgi:IclR family transcriptional regulator, KDG regulon repressor